MIGTLIDGLWDGQVNYIAPYYEVGEDFDVSFSAVNGIPTEDKTAEFENICTGGIRLS